MRQLNISEERAFPLKTAIIRTFQKQTFAHCHMDVFIWREKKVLIGITVARTHIGINTKRRLEQTLTLFC